MIGKLISGRYLIESLIGSGGMANVYKAYDNMLGRTVALKVLKAEHRGDMEFVRRFEREARAVLTLSHENIVRSYAVGEDGDISYIVLEYVEGSTLKELIKSDGPISPKVAVSITAQVLDALAHAHESGIIHRDVKPQNVIITPRGKAKLTDFGIARDVAATTRTYAGSNVVPTSPFTSGSFSFLRKALSATSWMFTSMVVSRSWPSCGSTSTKLTRWFLTLVRWPMPGVPRRILSKLSSRPHLAEPEESRNRSPSVREARAP